MTTTNAYKNRQGYEKNVLKWKNISVNELIAFFERIEYRLSITWGREREKVPLEKFGGGRVGVGGLLLKTFPLPLTRIYDFLYPIND